MVTVALAALLVLKVVRSCFRCGLRVVDVFAVDMLRNGMLGIVAVVVFCC